MNIPVQLQNDEKVIALLRRHPVYITLQMIGLFALAILLTAALIWLGDLFTPLRWVANIVAALTLFAILVIAALALYRYYNDLWLITDQRLVDSIKRNPFNHQVASADLLNVQDISVSKNGFFATIFNFGDVRCQTAATNQAFTLLGVPNPNGVLELIDQTRDRARERAMKMGIVGQG